MSKNSDWDIPASTFNFKKDLEYGQKGEGLYMLKYQLKRKILHLVCLEF